MKRTGQPPAVVHPYVIRLTHWVNAIAVPILTLSGLEIFHAFPSFGSKIPQRNLIDFPSAFRLGGWLGGALRWHFTFMWIFACNAAVYAGYLLLSGSFRRLYIGKSELREIWPVLGSYMVFKFRNVESHNYNPLQKLAYLAALALGLICLLSGILLYKPVQIGLTGWTEAFQFVRLVHFCSMLGLVIFAVGHLVMVGLHGWHKFLDMLIGTRRAQGITDH